MVDTLFPGSVVRAEGTALDLGLVVEDARAYWPLCFIDENAGPQRLITIGHPPKVVGHAWVIDRRTLTLWGYQVFTEAREI